MGFNYRVLAHQYKDEVYFQIHEVYYDKENKPNGYTANPITIGGQTTEEISWVLDKIKECLSKPILWEGDQFPTEYKPNNNESSTGDPGAERSAT